MYSHIAAPDVLPNLEHIFAKEFEASREDARSASTSALDNLPFTLPAPNEVSGLKILVVDDFVDSANTLAEVLRCNGHTVRVCYSGAAALEAIKNFRPHVCLLDLAMPEMNGLELASQLKMATPTGPLLLIATTAFGDLDTRIQTALTGFHYHFIKPVDFTILFEALSKFEQSLRRPTRDERSTSCQSGR